MTRKKRQVNLLTSEEVKMLRPRIGEMLEAGSYGILRKRSLAIDGSRALFAAWAASAAQCGDTSQLGFITGWLKAIDWEPEAADTSIRAAIQLAGDDARLRALLYPLEATMSHSIISPMIAWLDPDRPAERKVLEKLSGNLYRHIAKEARDRLATANAVPWWHGYFDHDPSAGLDEAAMSDLQPKFARYMELLDTDRDDYVDELFSLVQRFPPQAKSGACLRIARHWRYKRLLGPVLGELLSVEGGARMFCDLVKENDEETYYDLGEGVKYLPSSTTPEQRADLAREALSRLEGTTEKDFDDVLGRPSTYSRIAALSWHHDQDPTPVLDLLVEMADPNADSPSYGVGYWNALVDRLDARWLPLLQERFEQALEGDFLGRFSVLGPSLKSVAKRFPEAERRRMAFDVLNRKEAKRTVEWAVDTVVHLAPEELDRWLDDPRVRKHAFHLSTPEIFIRGRRELRAGTLAPNEVGAMASQVSSLFGGQVNLFGRRRAGQPRQNATKKSNPVRDAIVAAAPDLAGPLTEEEWALIRRLRAELPASKVDEAGLEFLIPEGPWHPEDFAWLERLVDYVVTSKAQWAYFAALLCARHPSPEVLPLLEKLDDIEDPFDHLDDRAKEISDEVRRALGVPTKYGDGDTEEEDALDPDGTDDW